jgi:hypothetical protein
MEDLTANNIASQSFNLEAGGLSYNITTELVEEHIGINVKRQFSPFTYEAHYSLEDLQKAERIFYMYDTVEAAYCMIKSKLNNKKAEICEIDDELNLKLIMEIDHNEKIIVLKIYKNSESDLSIVVNDMSVIIQQLMDKVKLLENPPKLKDSCIVKQCEVDLIKGWLSSLGSVEFSLLYKGCIHGDKASDFHSRCDNKGPTITFIQTVGGRRFGGFTSLDWDQSENIKSSDPHAFVFSLDHKRKFVITDQTKVIGCFSGNLPFFGNNDIRIESDYGKVKSRSEFPLCYGTGEDFGDFNPSTMLSGTQHFEPAKIEVFSVRIV